MYTSGVTQTIGSIHTQRTRTCQSYSEWNAYGGMCQQSDQCLTSVIVGSVYVRSCHSAVSSSFHAQSS